MAQIGKPTIHITTVLNQLKSGFTRTKADKMYNPNIGSIEEIYGLTPAVVKILFDHPKLKGVRTSAVVEPPFILVDDEGEEQNAEGVVNQPMEVLETPIVENSDSTTSEEEVSAEANENFF